MASALERAARAAQRDYVDGATWPDVARAVLMAVREPSEEMIKAAEDREEDIVGTYGCADPEGALTNDGAKICFTAMIDAILNEKE